MNKKRILFCLTLVFALTAFSTPFASAAESISYEETFEDDTVNSNPIGSWYNYGESGLTWQNVTNISAEFIIMIIVMMVFIIAALGVITL